MRSLVLAAAALMIGLATILAISASHKRDGAAAAQQSQQAGQTQQPQTQPTPADGVRRVTVEELRAALDKGTAIVVDVRGEESYKSGHIKGAIWIPSNEIVNRIKELPKDKLVVAYCS